MIRIYSRGIARIPHLPEFLAEPVSLGGRGPVRAVAGWGLRPTTRRARRAARRLAVPYLALEDGFLRSVEPGPGAPALSLVVDDLGIYYDAGRPSRLEALIAQPLGAAGQDRAAALIDAWRLARVSKYNHLRERSALPPQPYVLVVDQTFGDASVRFGQADADSFRRMLDAAVAEHPDCTIVVKTHPDVVSGRKRGYLPAVPAGSRIRLLAEHVHPVGLIEHARAVYCVTSQVGFEGLLWGRPVHTFGMPFYAGWGLTADALPAPMRRGRASLEQLVHAALLAYPRYVHPETGRRCEAEDVVAYLALQRRMRERFPAEVYAHGISRYKRPWVRLFCQGSRVRFAPRRAVPAGACRLVWGRGGEGDVDADAVHLEDGFLRSVGLGKDLIRPLSWVMDTRGIYFDATRPSDLEHLLQNTQFDDALLARAATLRARIVTANLSKYNLSGAPWQPRVPDDGRPVILVPGQVEADASIAWGAPGVRGNLELLRAVRSAYPRAWIVYKPHPDVVAGLAASGRDEARAAEWCDEVVSAAGIVEVVSRVDEVHTLTSLAGFEALLRGKPVTCYGQPFYAGWGLTHDLLPIARRTRRLTLDELTAGVLILYPTYISRTTGAFATPERALDELLAWRAGQPPRMPPWRRVLRWALRRRG